jgi:hypothetical protein
LGRFKSKQASKQQASKRIFWQFLRKAKRRRRRRKRRATTSSLAEQQYPSTTRMPLHNWNWQFEGPTSFPKDG